MISNNAREVSNTRGCSILPIIPSAVPKRGRHDLLDPGCQRRRGLRMASSHRPVLSLIPNPTALLDISGFACGGGIDHRGYVRSCDRLNGLARHPARAGQRRPPPSTRRSTWRAKPIARAIRRMPRYAVGARPESAWTVVGCTAHPGSGRSCIATWAALASETSPTKLARYHRARGQARPRLRRFR